MSENSNKTFAPKDVTDLELEQIEEKLGISSGAWDMVDPKEIVSQCWNVLVKRIRKV